MPESNRGSYTPAMMKWKHFGSRGKSTGPRSFVVEDNGCLSAHIGITTTEFVSPNAPALAISAVHPVEWLSTRSGSMLGTMLMLKAFSQGRVQYSTGSTETGNKILRSCGFQEIAPIPNYYHFFRPAKREVWGLIHGKQKFAKGIIMFLVDMTRSWFHPGLGRHSPGLTLRRVEKFSDDVTKVFSSAKLKFTCTLRSPELLNYFLTAPGGRFSGWMIERDARPVGFALTSITEREGVRMGNIVDCFIAEDAPAPWRAAIRMLKAELKTRGCDLAKAIGSAPWMQAALRENGFFRRGKNTFFLRDPQHLVPRDRQFHVTFLDGDLAY